VYVKWLDSAVRPGWIYGDEEDYSPKVIESIGFVVTETDQCLVLTCGQSDTGGVVYPLVIPSGCIQEKQIIEL
jgi:hypothetical protein